MKFDTKVIHAAIKPDPDTGSIVTPIHQTATYVMNKVGQDKGYDYTRSANPTRKIMEDHLAALDNGKFGIAFASGMAAIDSSLKLLKSGDIIDCISCNSLLYYYCRYYRQRLVAWYTGSIWLK